MTDTDIKAPEGGFDEPGYTQVPHAFLDRMQDLTMAELKLMLIVCRHTLGWQEERIFASHSTLAEKSGLSPTSVNTAIKALLERRWIVKQSMGQSFSYRLNFKRKKSPMAPPQNLVTTPKFGEAPPQNLGQQPPQNLGCLYKDTIKEKESTADADGDHEKVVEEFVKAYEEKFGSKYRFQGGRDGKAAKKLLESKLTPGAIVAVAVQAWAKADEDPRQFFNCRQAATLHGLDNCWNQINAELRTQPKKKASAPLWKQQEVLKKMIDEHPANPTGAGDSRVKITDMMKQNYKSLRDKLKDVEEQIAGVKND